MGFLFVSMLNVHNKPKLNVHNKPTGKEKCSFLASHIRGAVPCPSFVEQSFVGTVRSCIPFVSIGRDPRVLLWAAAEILPAVLSPPTKGPQRANSGGEPGGNTKALFRGGYWEVSINQLSPPFLSSSDWPSPSDTSESSTKVDFGGLERTMMFCSCAWYSSVRSSRGERMPGEGQGRRGGSNCVDP